MCCSVVFGVTLRLLVINISSSSPAINTAAYYQWCVITCEMVAVVYQRLRLQHPVSYSVNTGSQARYRLRIVISAYPTCIPCPFGGVPVGILLCHLARKNYNGVATLRWKKFDMFIRFDTIHERDKHTHTHRERQTVTPHDGIGRAYAYHKSISCKQHSSNLYHKELLALLLNPGPCTSRLKVLRKSTYLPSSSSSSSTTTTSSSLSECFTGAQWN